MNQQQCWAQPQKANARFRMRYRCWSALELQHHVLRSWEG
jgi:hypothetical protein